MGLLFQSQNFYYCPGTFIIVLGLLFLCCDFCYCPGTFIIVLGLFFVLGLLIISNQVIGTYTLGNIGTVPKVPIIPIAYSTLPTHYFTWSPKCHRLFYICTFYTHIKYFLRNSDIKANAAFKLGLVKSNRVHIIKNSCKLQLVIGQCTEHEYKYKHTLHIRTYR